MMAGMLTLILTGLLRMLRTRQSLVLENLALGHQLAVPPRPPPPPHPPAPPVPGAREPRVAAPTGRPPAHRAAPTPADLRPAVVGPAVPYMEGLDGCPLPLPNPC